MVASRHHAGSYVATQLVLQKQREGDKNNAPLQVRMVHYQWNYSEVGGNKRTTKKRPLING